MERRTFLTGSGGVLTAAVAGCSGNGGTDESNDGDDESDEDPESTATGTEGSGDSETREVGEPSTPDLLSATWETYVTDPVVLSGEGNSNETFTLESGFTAIEYSFDGYELFAQLVDSDGNTVRRINELNGGSGVDGVPVEAGEYTFEIEADSSWRIALGSPDASPDAVQLPPASVTGFGNDVAGPVDISGGETISVTHDGEADFIVESVRADGTGEAAVEGVANEFSGPYEDETTLSDAGVRWFPVYASGSWELDIE